MNINPKNHTDIEKLYKCLDNSQESEQFGGVKTLVVSDLPTLHEVLMLKPQPCLDFDSALAIAFLISDSPLQV